MKRFESRVAIVTGAGCVGPGWGNGRAMAVRLAEEGARVLAVDRDQSVWKKRWSGRGRRAVPSRSLPAMSPALRAFGR